MATLNNANISEIEELIKLISKLPGLGPKSARRIILKLINNKEDLMKSFLMTLNDLYKNVSRCQYCGALKSNYLDVITAKIHLQKPKNMCS